MRIVRPHSRKTKSGRTTVRRHARKGSSKKKKENNQIQANIRRQVILEYKADLTKQLKAKKKVSIPSFGSLYVKNRRAIKGGKKGMMFGKPYITKAKPARKIIKFRPAKALKEAV